MDPRLLPLSDPRPEDLDRHRLQLLRPHEIAARLEERSVVFLPLGTLEFHARHLPIGLDALNAEEICLRAAAEQGGLVYPTLYYGTGGSHGSFPWSIIPPSGTEIEALLAYSLERLDELGVELAVMFTGHFAPEQVALVEDAADAVERSRSSDARPRPVGGWRDRPRDRTRPRGPLRDDPAACTPVRRA